MELSVLYFISFYISASSAIVPTISYLFRHKVGYPRYLHFIGNSVILSGLTDLIVFVLVYYRIIAPVPFIEYSFIIGYFCLLSLFYYEILFDKEKKGGPYLVAILFHGFCTIALLYLLSRGIFTYNGLIFSLGYFAFLLYSIYYFKKTLNISHDQRPHSSGVLWINAGILTYTSVAVWAFILRDQSISGLSINAIYVVWTIHNIFNTIKNLLIAKGLYESSRSLKQRNKNS